MSGVMSVKIPKRKCPRGFLCTLVSQVQAVAGLTDMCMAYEKPRMKIHSYESRPTHVVSVIDYVCECNLLNINKMSQK